MIVVVCPDCHRRLQLADVAGGHEGKCAHCGKLVRLGGSPAVPTNPGLSSHETASNVGPEVDSHPPAPPRAVPAGYEFLSPPQRPDEIGRLGDYRVLQLLGQGAMGMVFRAEDPGLARILALKVMLPSVASAAENRERFLREAQATALVNHPNVIPIYKIGEDRGVPYLAMPLLKGELLEARLNRERRLSIGDAARIGREIAAGLAAAHERNLIHRDIKPANLWLEAVQRRNATDRVKILDFGLARIGDAGLTTPGAVLGTPAYMAPEQAKGLPVDYRCDLFSLGSVLYRMLTGERAFQGNEVFAVLMALTTVHPPPPHEVNPAVPPGLSRLVMHLLAKEPDDRPQSAAEVVAALGSLEQSGRAGSSGDIPLYRAGSSTAIPAGGGSPGASASYSKTLQLPEPGGSAKPANRAYTAAVVAVAVLIGGLLAYSARSLLGARPQGTLLLNVSPPGSEVLVDSRAVELNANGPSTLTLSPGKHELKILHGDYHGRTLNVDVVAGNNEPLTIELEKLTPKEGAREGAREGAKEGVPPVVPRETPPQPEPPAPPQVETKIPPAKESIRPPEKLPESVKEKPPEPAKTEVKNPESKQGESASTVPKPPPDKMARPSELAPPRPKPSGMSLDRRAALWVLDHGGEVVLQASNKRTSDRVRDRAKLPKARFDLVIVGLDKCKKVDDDGLSALEGLEQLTELDLSGTGVTDRGIAKLRTLRILSTLSLSNTAIGDEAVPALERLDGLQFLFLQNTKITSKGVQQLKKALPRCNITEP
jgi:serine/threonine protein kinase